MTSEWKWTLIINKSIGNGTAVFLSILSCLAVSTCQGAITIQFAPSQTTVQSNGSNQTFTIDLLITHDGSADLSTFSGITVDMPDLGTNLVLGNGQEVDFDYPAGAQVKRSSNTNRYSFGASSTTQNYDITQGATKSLMTVDFLLDGSVTSGTFNLDLSLRDAQRDLANNGTLTDTSSEVTVISGLFEVSSAVAVPEPSILWIGILSTAWLGRRRFA